MVTLVSIKLRGESNIIDDNPTMKQAEEISQQFIWDPNNFNVFIYFLNVLISPLLRSRFLVYSQCIALVVVRVSLLSSLPMFRYKITILMVLLVIYANFISTQYLFYTDSRGKDTPWQGWTNISSALGSPSPSYLH